MEFLSSIVKLAKVLILLDFNIHVADASSNAAAELASI